MSFVKVRNVDPRGDLALFVDGETQEVEAGGVLTVTAEEAGTEPGWRKATDDETRDVAAVIVGHAIDYSTVTSFEDLDPEVQRVIGQKTGRDHRFHAGDLEVYDLGSGLLAQVGTWEKAGSRAAAPAPTGPVQIQDGQTVTTTDGTAKGGE